MNLIIVTILLMIAYAIIALTVHAIALSMETGDPIQTFVASVFWPITIILLIFSIIHTEIIELLSKRKNNC